VLLFVEDDYIVAVFFVKKFWMLVKIGKPFVFQFGCLMRDDNMLIQEKKMIEAAHANFTH
jgi:hypothetical protein